MSIHFDHPLMLLLLALAAPVVLLGLGRMAGLDTLRRWTAISLRLLVLLLLVLMLAGLHAVRKHSDLTVVAVLDESESIRRLAKPPVTSTPLAATTQPVTDITNWLDQYLTVAAEQRKPDDRLGVIAFDGRPTVRAMPATQTQLDSGTLPQPSDGTDTPSALRLAMAMFPPDSGKRLLLASDGNDTTSPGALLTVAREAKAAGVPIDVLPIEYRIEHEAMVDGVFAPPEASEGQTIAVRIVLRGTEPVPGLLFLQRDGVPIGATGQGDRGRPVRASDWVPQENASGTGQYVAVLTQQVRMDRSGATRFSAIFEPALGRDTISANNQGESFTLVHGKGRVLVASNVPDGHGIELPAALRVAGLEIEEVKGYALPPDLAGLHRYDAVVLQDVPAENVTPAQQEALATYVTELGGGLLMVGGENSFGAGGWANSPIDAVLPVDCSVQSLKVIPTGALIIVLDRSGSMSGELPGSNITKQAAANRAAMLALQTLYPQDYCGVLAFDEEVQWVQPLAINSDSAGVQARVKAIEPRGGTEIAKALDAAIQAYARINAPDLVVRHIVLLTDGYGAPADYGPIMTRAQQLGVTVSTIGVGGDVDTALLTKLAQQGKGMYYPVNDARKLPQVFIKEARTIRRTLIKEQQFRPLVFSQGSPILQGLVSMPNLGGLVLTGYKGGGEKPDARVFMPLVGPDKVPLFAHWQIGLGQTAAFTSDATVRWAQTWMSWPGYTDFWGRTVRMISRAATSRDLDMIVAAHDQTLRIRVEASQGESASSAATPQFANALRMIGSVIQPDGSTRSVVLTQTGPGLYETQIPAAQSGSYIVSVFASDGKNAPRAVHGGVTRPPGPELRFLSSNQAILLEVASITGGRVLNPKQAEPGVLFRRDVPIEGRSLRPLWRELLVLLLIALLLDVAVRRIAWDWLSIRRLVLAQVDAVTAIFRNRDIEAVATLGALRKRASQVNTKLTGHDAPVTETSAEASTSRVVTGELRTKKFEVDPAKIEEARKALEAEQAQASSAPKKDKSSSNAPSSQQEQGPTTSRLLDAKRRARRNLGDQDN